MRTVVFRLLSKSFIVLLSLFIFLSPQSMALACGMVLNFDLYSNRFDFGMETDHEVYINYQDGKEKMLVSIATEETDPTKKSLWLFPIPAQPDDIKIDVLKTVPDFTGEDIEITANEAIEDIRMNLLSTQIYPIPFTMLMGSSPTINTTLPLPTLGTDGISRGTNVTVFNHIEKEGITSEVITAKTATGLYTYLQKKGLSIQEGAIPVLANYIGKDFSFIASWLTSTSMRVPGDDPIQKGFFVSFPTKRLYYPLLPENVYGDMAMPLSLRIVGHVSPDLPQVLKEYEVQPRYYLQEDYAVPTDLQPFFETEQLELRYTKIDFEIPGNKFTEDLWIDTHAPLWTYGATALTAYPIAITILLLVLTSILAGAGATYIAFNNKRNRKDVLRYALYSAANCLTLFALIFSIILWKTTPQKTRNDARKLTYLLVFSLLFLFMTGVLTTLLDLLF